ncbi:WD repeat-containing protein 74-like [Melia azedarach]|uniref:WD repeat-containing protein 74-like n=1 Tax=Melia azedarach TaxID=155640 RepID=A0ACC1XM79_MELAZ|nr:WD repeat-containing protein 74-like [Melia azedarach]
MPRTTTLDCPGCPPLRALTFDSLGLIKVVEARGEQGGVSKVVERWGDPDASKCVLAASIDDSKNDPLLAVARKSGLIEILNPLNGDLRVSISNAGDAGARPEDDGIAGLHLFKRQRMESSRSCTLLTCTTKGNASMRSIDISNVPSESSSNGCLKSWNVCASGTVLCSKVDRNENYALFGGKGIEVNVWDLEKCMKIWTAKPPPKNSLGIFTPTWFTSATFLSIDDHRKFVAGTNNHQVHLYDTSAQRRPIMSFDFRETPIKAVAAEPESYNIYIGNGSGDLASVDIRMGKLLGCFIGKCSGSIRSIARHPTLPVIASCGLDGYLRLWDIKTRQLLSAVFLKQHLADVVFDSAFADKEVAPAAADPLVHEVQNRNDIEEHEAETMPMKRKKAPKGKDKSKTKASKENDESKKLKSKKKSKRVTGDSHDDDS